MRNVQYIFQADTVQLGKAEVLQALPIRNIEQVSPFLLLHHYKKLNIAPGEVELDVAPHPHRGFEPVTFLFAGGLHHRDSRGNEGLLKSGDVQWMTAGMGIIHSEQAS
ncbi:MAG: pirin family protein, partial [Chitinophagales bacterium]